MSKDRSVWTFAMIGLSVLVGVILIAWIVGTLIGILG